MLAWERSARLADHKWRDVSLWRLIRNRAIDSYLACLEVRGQSNYNRPGIRNLAGLIFGIVISLAHAFRLRRRKYLVIGFPRRSREGGEWVDPFSDPLIDFLGESNVVCLEKPFVGLHCRPPRTRNIVYYDWLMSLSVGVAFLFGWLGRFVARGPADELAAAVAGYMRVGRGSIRRIIYRELIRFRIEADFVRLALAIVRPEVILLTSRWVHLPIIYACKKAGVRVLELQHGVPNEQGFKYSTIHDSALDPDWFLTFGAHWNDFDWGMPRDRVAAIGYRYIWQRRSALAGKMRREASRVMLVSQPDMASILAAAFEEIAAANEDVEFLLKLHPQDTHGWEQRYPVGKRRNVKVCDTPTAELYELFSECRAVIGHNSTVLFEASFFGLRVGILNADGTNECPALQYVGRYNFFEIRSPGQVAGMLRAQAQGKVTENPFLADFVQQEFARLASAA